VIQLHSLKVYLHCFIPTFVVCTDITCTAAMIICSLPAMHTHTYTHNTHTHTHTKYILTHTHNTHTHSHTLTYPPQHHHGINHVTLPTRSDHEDLTHFLLSSRLTVNVFDGDSLMLLGTAALPLKVSSTGKYLATVIPPPPTIGCYDGYR